MTRWTERGMSSLLAVALLHATSFLSMGIAQEPVPAGDSESEFQVDELVEIEVLGKWVAGQIVKETAEDSDSYLVKFQHQGRRFERVYPHSKIRRPTDTPVMPLSVLRRWSDSTGVYSVQAHLLEVTEHEALLMKPDGSQVHVGLDKLSQSDRLLARKLALRAKQKEEIKEALAAETRGEPVGEGRSRRPSERRSRSRPAEPAEPAEPSEHALTGDELAAALGADEPIPADSPPPEGTPPAAASESPSNPLGGLAALGSELLTGTDRRPTNASGAPAASEIAVAEAKTVTVDSSLPWSFAPEPLASAYADDLVLDLPPVEGKVVAMHLVVTADGARAVGQFVRDSGEPAVVNVTISPQENSATPLSATGLQQILDIGPDGQQIVGTGQAVDGKVTIGIWTIQGEGMKQEVAWQAPAWTQIHRAVWFDPRQLLLWVDDQVAMVEFDESWTARVRYGLAGATGMAVMPARKHVTVQMADGIVLLAAATGEQVGWIAMPSGPATAMAFAPEGLTLVTASAEGLAQWDLNTGSQQVLIPFTEQVRRLDALTSEFILVNGTDLVRLSSQETVRNYQADSPLIEPTMTAVGGSLWFLVPPAAAAPPQLVHLALLPTELESRADTPQTNWLLGRGGRQPQPSENGQRH